MAVVVALPLAFFVALSPASAARFTATCQVEGQIAGSIRNIFAVYPSGGQGMVDAISAAVLQNSDLSQDVIAAAQGASAAAVASAGDGLAMAYALLNRSDPSRASQINSYMRCGDSRLQTAFAYARTVSTVSSPFGLGLSPSGGGGGLVSPSRP